MSTNLRCRIEGKQIKEEQRQRMTNKNHEKRIGNRSMRAKTAAMISVFTSQDLTVIDYTEVLDWQTKDILTSTRIKYANQIA